MQDTPKTVATYQVDLAANDYKAVFQYNRSIDKVWVTDGSASTNEGRTKLVKVSRDWMKEEYAAPQASLDTGRPLYYVPAIIGLAPQQSALTSGNFTAEFTYDSEELTLGDDHWDKTGVLFAPPSDGVYTMIVQGKWWSRFLTADANENYWSVNHPELLVLGAMLEMEKARRNTQGVNDMRAAIVDQLRGIDIDLSANDIAEVDYVSDELVERL
jgi:hypothetical protein